MEVRMRKFIVSWLDKFSVGSLLVGFYQGNTYAVCLGIAALLAALYMQWREN
jgi:hypothetical protein